MRTMDELTLREAKSGDLPAIVHMLADDKLGAQREHFSDPLPECYTKAYERIAADPNQYLIVAERKGEIVGTLQLSLLQYLAHKGAMRAQIEAVRISRAHRGKGLGRKMIQQTITIAREKKARMVQLTTDKQRPESIQFYKDLGFVPTHEGMKLHFGS